MSHLSLHRLEPGDPENLLSRESRQRIRAAYMAADLIRTQALSRLRTRYSAKPSRGIGFDEYLCTGSAFVDWTESNMKAARTVLRVEAVEYRKLGLPFSEFHKIMRGNIEAAVNSLELSQLQKQVLELEFVWATSRQAEDEPRSVERSDKNVSEAVATVSRSIESPLAAARVAEYMRRHAHSQAVFAEKAHIAERTLRRLLKTSRATASTWAEVAAAMGIKPDELLRAGH